VVHRNPGKKVKRMDTSAQLHHAGPRGTEYIQDADARSKSLGKRKGTLFEKVMNYGIFKDMTKFKTFAHHR